MNFEIYQNFRNLYKYSGYTEPEWVRIANFPWHDYVQQMYGQYYYTIHTNTSRYCVCDGRAIVSVLNAFFGIWIHIQTYCPKWGYYE